MNIEKIIKETSFTFARSSGAGGQNVNKVETKVILHFNISESKSLTEKEKEVLLIKLANKINKNKELVLSDSSTRSQLKNKKNVIKKFLSLIQKALTLREKRKKTKPSKSANLKRLKRKKARSEKKDMRKKLDY